MKHYRFSMIAIVSIFLFVSCATDKEIAVQPEPEIIQPAPTPEPEPEPKPEPAVKAQDSSEDVVASFGAVTITRKKYDETKCEIEKVVANLNRITSEQNYKEWLEVLSDEYKKVYSQPSVLQSSSESLPIKGIRLNNLQDYFTYVFVPSRQKIRVDSIEFLSPSKVNVIMNDGKSDRQLLVYKIEKIKNLWKLVP
ncbi:hypothetical protein DWQ65_04245 [Treponema phagedenis]|uniref:Lipoprotein n=1 Tax=Treponema phagedenis TaxID=162 RepID=A0A0B7GX95_TREPH|nr:hypothetical protein [Treponema phagedenis]QEJ95041.1 hypothetical protein FUT79_07405 [Treponema phagedenis]QEJ98125.1 hypothetical protein FUT82_09020 [Treponema phagedenis]QEK03633.1 hypothetical protein FUT83_07325 [Treponema phagedenis]QEK09251.1 hypothetical protein FUT81_07235 [Treponema phagedenis]